jgi:predicted trehalose synthase
VEREATLAVTCDEEFSNLFESCFNIRVMNRPQVELRAAGAWLTVAPDGDVHVGEDAPGALALALTRAVAGPDPVFTASPGQVQVRRDAPVGLTTSSVRTVDVDQTHRSWVVADRLQVKVGRTIGSLDHGADQSRRASPGGAVPALRGTVGWTGPDGSHVLATVTDHVVGAQDGWTWAVEDVLTALDAATPPDPSWPAELGALTAHLHLSLATDPPPPGVPGPDPDPTARALVALGQTLAATTGLTHRRLAARAAAVRAAITGAPAHPSSIPFAVHGDLHVGQVLRADGRYWVVDLDGDPQIGPWVDHAARDLAHLLVSVDTVARVVQRRLGAADPRVLDWADRAREDLGTAYRAVLVQAGRAELLDARLMPAFEAEQVLRELLYAARYLPRWTYAGEGALLARYGTDGAAPCGACTDPFCGTVEEDPWEPPRSVPTSS